MRHTRRATGRETEIPIEQSLLPDRIEQSARILYEMPFVPERFGHFATQARLRVFRNAVRIANDVTDTGLIQIIDNQSGVMSPAQRDDPVSHVGGALGHPPDRLREKRIRCPYPFRRVGRHVHFRIVKEIAFGFRLRIPQADYLGSLHGKNVPEHRPLSDDETRQKKLLHCPGIDFRLHSGIFHRPQQVVRHQPCVPEPGPAQRKRTKSVGRRTQCAVPL